jgi:biotin carboxylase
MAHTPTILCLASYFKGGLFLEECKRLGCHTILVTEQKLEHEAWPREAIDELFFMHDLAKQPDITHAVSYLARDRVLHSLIALDDYDVETAAALREHLRLQGLGSSAARLFRDKLAMRVQAAAHALPVPDFVHVLNYNSLAAFMERVPPPWVLKPRAEAGSMGIRKVHAADEVWALLRDLGDRQSYYLLERFVPGDVYHVDSVIWDGEVVFAQAHKYGLPPMTVYQGGGVFASSTLPYGGEEDEALRTLNHRVIAALGMGRGVTHAEYIRSYDGGRYHFLEIAARVGGAGTDKLVEMASGVNPWREWARLEVATLTGQSYAPPARRNEYAGLMVTLARQEYPDTSAYHDPEVAWRLDKKHHVGMVVASSDYGRVQHLIGDYVPRFATDFTAVEAPLDRPPE